MQSIYDLTLDELNNYLKDNDFSSFHSKQIYKWLFEKRVNSFNEMSDISLKLIDKLNHDFIINRFNIKKKEESKDGTIKYLFELEDGSLIESVLMVFDYGFSACISSQVGCNMGCKFCASGLLKKQRDLKPSELVLQVLMIQEDLDKRNERLGNIVVMGTGEPFDNYDNVMKALNIINNTYALAIGARHISISTCGIVPMIKRFAHENVQYNLAISLHAANNALRSELMPINNAYTLEELMDAIKEYANLNNRRITFEYLLLKGVNDTKNDVSDIKKLLNGLNAYINLIPYNEVKENDFKSTSEENALRFYDMLKKAQIAVTLRQKRGTDINAACGQLRAKEMLKK